MALVEVTAVRRSSKDHQDSRRTIGWKPEDLEDESLLFPPAIVSRSRPQGQTASDALRDLPRAGAWKCNAPSLTKKAEDEMFTTVPVITLPEGATDSQARALASKAQRAGWPLLIRPHPSASTEESRKATADHLESLLKGFDEDLNLDNVGAYDPECKKWAGIRHLNEAESSRLKEGLDGDTTPRGLYKALVEEKGLPIGAKIMLGNRGARLSAGEKQVLHALRKNGYMESASTPVWDQDLEDYGVLFVHGKGHRTGAHIDDDNGATYFYLKVLTGKKRLRIWPILDATTLDYWRTAENKLEAGDIEFPFRGFNYNDEQSGGISGRWTERGFEWGLSGDAKHQYREDPNDIANEAFRCYVEIDLMPGEELFVGASLPHQVETLEPTIAISRNFRFTNFAWISRARLNHFFTAHGETPTEEADEVTRDDILSIDVALDEVKPVFDHHQITKMWRAGLHPKFQTEEPANFDELATGVLMAWADPSLLESPASPAAAAAQADAVLGRDAAGQELGRGRLSSKQSVALLVLPFVILGLGIFTFNRCSQHAEASKSTRGQQAEPGI
eukprot:CAMPEP_0206441928 /NCGR_PEP_ID=MMETSP0324_2-20121206/13543_1 /ASSEMBLY_ACC=CAM_ASM_000836 /TAXON_ID=2866 /ORGANISM="Crypthecodinium cohnii, Strain Seligo" /LENGTH=560 /DNA_ID=CAMNT_0053909723 /DNA_START=208 /DNA_END=1890 /DNA_ORIENTATION=-